LVSHKIINMICRVILTSGARANETCNRPCRNGFSICMMHHNLDTERKKVTWEELSKPKQKQFRDILDTYIEEGTWMQHVLQLVQTFRLVDFPKEEIECCLHAFRISHTKQSIVYKNGIMYVSDPHKGRCIKVDNGTP